MEHDPMASGKRVLEAQEGAGGHRRRDRGAGNEQKANA